MATTPVRPAQGLAQNPSAVVRALLSTPPIKPPPTSGVPPISQIVQGLRQPPVPTQLGAGPLAGKPPMSPSPLSPKPPANAPQPPAPPAAPPASNINPYTGQPLGPNEYVGVAGSEADHPGMTRIPPPGWWDPSNPNYERRSYYRDKGGNIVAIEPGYQGDSGHPYDTGRAGERNSEIPAGTDIVRMSQPGMPTWGPGQKRPEPSKLAAPPAGPPAGPPGPPGDPTRAGSMSGALAASDPNSQLMQLIQALIGRTHALRPGTG